MRTILKNGSIIDGTGAKPYIGDILIEDDKIAEIGDSIDEKADSLL